MCSRTPTRRSSASTGSSPRRRSTRRCASRLASTGSTPSWRTTATWTAWSSAYDETAERLDALIGDNQYDVRVIVQDLRVTADNLRALSETVKRYPAGALFGGPPEKVQLPGTASELSVERLGLAAALRCPDPRRLLDRQTDPPGRRRTSWIRRWPRPPAAARRPETLLMGNVRVAAAYAGNALVYRMDDVQYTSDPYHAFIAEPGAMLGNRMAEWLDHAGPFKTVAQPGSAQPAVRARGYRDRALRRFPRGKVVPRRC